MTTVRRLSVDDAPLFRALRLESNLTDPAAFRRTLAEEQAKPLTWYEQRITSDAIFGAFSETGELVGMAGFTSGGGTRDGPKGRLWNVYVHPSQRGQGVGEAVVRAVIDHARPMLPDLHLSVMADNPSARKLYERLGFILSHIEHEIEQHGGDYTADEAHYVLRLRDNR